MKRHIITQDECPICQQHSESLSHALWECPGSSDVWGEERSPVRKWKWTIGSIQALWTKISESLSPHSQALCAIILRHIWIRRNTFADEGNFIHPKQVMSNAVQQLKNY